MEWQEEVLYYPGSEQQRCWSDCADVQYFFGLFFFKKNFFASKNSLALKKFRAF